MLLPDREPAMEASAKDKKGSRKLLNMRCCDQSSMLGLGALVCTLLTASPVRAAQPVTIAGTEAALQQCVRVSLGMSRSKAEHIIGQPLPSEDNFLMLGQAQCFIAISVKNRVFWSIAAFKISTDLSMDDVAAKITQGLPFHAQDFGKLTIERTVGKNLSMSYGPIDRRLSITVVKETNFTVVSIGQRSPSIQKHDEPGFYAD